MELKEQTAIITGGGTGIGSGIARSLADLDMNLVICGRRFEPLERLSEQLGADDGQILAVQADVSRAKDVEHVVEAALSTFGSIDILINNAGIGGGAPIHQHAIEMWDEVLKVNLRGPFLMARATLPTMRAQGSGHIVNISSESATTHYAGNGAYGVSKHALNALSEYIQVENQEFGIRVDTICPGMVVTEMTRNNPGLDHEKSLHPKDLGDLVSWLVTRRSNIKIGTPILFQTMKNPWE